jgi:hypothetical protein
MGGVAFPDGFTVGADGDLGLPLEVGGFTALDMPNLLVSFEVIEHVEPKRCRAMLQMFHTLSRCKTDLCFSRAHCSAATRPLPSTARDDRCH